MDSDSECDSIVDIPFLHMEEDGDSLDEVRSPFCAYNISPLWLNG